MHLVSRTNECADIMVHYGGHLEAPITPENVTKNSKIPASPVRGVENREVSVLNNGEVKKPRFEDCS
jgi:hypothetical protein